MQLKWYIFQRALVTFSNGSSLPPSCQDLQSRQKSWHASSLFQYLVGKSSSSLGVQGWRSGESTRLPQMWHGFDCQIWCYMSVGFVGSLLCTKRFSPGTPVSPVLKKPPFDLICVNCYFEFAVSPISAPALKKLDTKIKFLSCYEKFLRVRMF